MVPMRLRPALLLFAALTLALPLTPAVSGACSSVLCVQPISCDRADCLFQPVCVPAALALCVGLPDHGPQPTLPDLCAGSATAFQISLDTGVNALDQALGQGTADPKWTLQAQPAGIPGAAYSHGPDPIPGTWATGSGSSWINHAPTTLSGPGGDYVYQVSYVVPASAYDVQVSGLYAADNSVILSDTDGFSSNLVATSAVDSFASFTMFSYNVPTTGAHLFTAKVHNRASSWGDDTATGLNVAATVSGLCKPKGPIVGATACADGARTFHFLLNTGIDAAGNPIPAGATDPHWVVAPASSSMSLGAAFGHGTQPNGAYASDSGATWINADPVWQAEPGGDTNYQVTYVLPANAYGVTVTGKYAADNSVIVADTDSQISLLVGSTSPDAYNPWNPFSYSVATTGYHTFSASVHNRLSSWGDDTETGLDVVAEVSGFCGDTIGPVKDVLDKLL